MIEDVYVFIVENKYFKHDFLVGLDLIVQFGLSQDCNLNIFQSKSKSYKKYDFRSKWSRFNVNFTEINIDLNHLEINKKKKIKDIINCNYYAFAKDKFDVGKVVNHAASVKLTEHRYVCRKPYRCNIVDQKEIENQVNKLLEADLIEESTSPFAAPVTLAFKRQIDGSKKKNRLCIDYSELNKIIVPESQPFPLIDDLIVKARDCGWFSVLDINSAFWSVPLREKDRYKTAFVTQTGHYNWKCLPFGLKTSPAIFQRILRNLIKRNGLDNFSVNYIDDILVFSKTFDEHLIHLDKVINSIFKEGFRLSLGKCEFAKTKVKYLGHIIENNLIYPIYDNVLPVRNFPKPTCQKNVRQFLGKVNFYRSYIPDSSVVLAPLHNLLKKNVSFYWDNKCEESFNIVKNILCSEPCLAIFSPEKETIIKSDASLEGIGAVLKQKQADGSFKPIAYFSKKLNEPQKRKKAIFLECLAIKEALMYWRHRLLGIRFTVFTDHKPLEKLKINTKFDDELRELMLHLSQFDFEIKYVPGETNIEADCLSRNPVLETDQALSEIRVVNLLEIDKILEDQELNINFENIHNIIDVNKVKYIEINGKKKVIVSDNLIKELIKDVHVKFGHIGSRHMEIILFREIYNKKLKSLIKDFCRTCSICIKNKTRTPMKFGKLSQLGPAKEPFEIMSMDTVGGFSSSSSKKKYFHLLVDHFSRYAYVLTSKSQTAKDFIRVLELVTLKNNKIGTLLTDQYPAITSKEFKNFVKENNIKLIFTAVNCPSSNGLNERLNQTLVNRLRCKVNENDINKKKPWSTLLEECVSEYNNTIHSVTGFSPNYLMNNVNFSIIKNGNCDVNDLAGDRQIAFKNSVKNHELNKIRYDKNKVNNSFNVDDFVFVEKGNILNRNKLDEIRSGPYRIISKLSDSIFQVDSGGKKVDSNIFHVSKLFPVL